MLLLIAVVLFSPITSVLVVVYVVQPVKVEGTAMAPTLNDEDRIFIGKQIGQLERGDIVVFYFPLDTSKSFLMRIIALPGEKIRLDADGQLNINDLPVSESYLSAERNRHPRRIPEQTLDSDSYWMMGDNRDASNDSRSFGPVPRRLIYGKVMMRYWPLGQPLK